MHSTQILSEPSHVFCESGSVILEGPDGLAATMTPAAARETAQRMLRAVEQAEA